MKKIAFPIIWYIFYTISLLPAQFLRAVSKIVFLVGFKLVGYRNSVIIQNLTKALPSKDYDEISDIAHKNMRFVSHLPFEWLRLMSVSPHKIKEKINLQSDNLAIQNTDNKRNFIVVMGHYQNWELGALLPLLIARPVYAIYKEQSSELSDYVSKRWRQRFGVKLIEMKDAARFMIKNRATPSVYILLSDQRPTYSKDKVQFLNQDTYVINGLERMQKHINAIVYYMEIDAQNNRKINFHLSEIDDRRNLTSEYFEHLEQSINKSPQFWLWSHKRWKNKQIRI